MARITMEQTKKAFEDIWAGLSAFQIWYSLGKIELIQKYRRSVLGPFWGVINTLVQATVTGFIFSFLFKIELAKFLPYLCISLIMWNLLMNSINESANTFISNGGILLQVKRPLTTYIYLTIWRNVIIFIHSLAGFFIVAFIFNIYPSTTYFLIPFGLGIFLLNIAWMCLLVSLISARFRDIPLIIQNGFSVLIWLTPVYYSLEQLSSVPRKIVDLNLFTYIFEVARSPFMNVIPPTSTWIIALMSASIGWFIAILLFIKLRSKVTFWI
jgi:ABC-type polysaccharide/polyol phosphate export permease